MSCTVVVHISSLPYYDDDDDGKATKNCIFTLKCLVNNSFTHIIGNDGWPRTL